MKDLLASLKRTAAGAMGIKPSPRLAERRVLFVCMGNICRSPTAEGVFRKLLAEHAADLDVDIESAGTHAYHVGQPPDPRACRAALRRGVDLSTLRARQVNAEDFEQFDFVLAMDESNREMLLEMCPIEHRERVRLLMEFAPQARYREVPDPYYGGSTGFEHVLDLVEEAGRGLIEHLRQTPPRRKEADTEPE